ncbi:MAG TPA: helix-turn-helix domain-containing protein [Candidatus Limnocylindria bacterium]|nr:helix-turn-helix domain-containing protein [Candidatus Limnocylindria bacterium]
MVSYGQFCPVALASEVFAERWTPLILRELLIGRHRFNELQHGVGGISQSLLVQRLRTLEQAGIVERAPNPAGRGSEYHLTKAGAELEGVLDRLAIWAQRWIELRDDCLDAAPLMQAIHMHLRADAIPIGPTVVRFDFTDPGQRTYWMLLRRPEAELCFHDPGKETDMVVTCDVEALTRVFLGRVPLARATARDRIRLDGPSDLVRSFPRWLGLHKFASYGTRLAAAR